MIKATTVRTALLGTLILAAACLAAAPASASTGLARGQARDGSAKLNFCDYTTNADGIAVWEWPGGHKRTGNRRYIKLVKDTAFNSIPYIASAKLHGMRWIYGQAIVPSNTGTISIFGWIGRNYLTKVTCGAEFFATSNGKVASTSKGEKFTSNPTEISGTFRRQTWVWGIATHASKAGWVGRKYLTKKYCRSGACHYVIKAKGVHEWILPGGKDGP